MLGARALVHSSRRRVRGMRAGIAAAVVGSIAGRAGPAAADPTAAEALPDVASRPLVLPAGAITASVSVELGIARLVPGDLISLAPSAWFGVTSRLTVGVIHGNAPIDRIAAGAGVCVRGDRCAHPYTGGGFDGRYSLRTGSLAVAAQARFLVRDVHPGKPAVTAGARLQYGRGWLAVATAPYLRLGLANRDRGNRAALVIPVWLGVHTSRRTLVALHTGYDSDLAVWRDGFHIPIGFDVDVAVTSHVELALEVGFASLLGPQSDYKSAAALVTAMVR